MSALPRILSAGVDEFIRAVGLAQIVEPDARSQSLRGRDRLRGSNCGMGRPKAARQVVIGPGAAKRAVKKHINLPV